MPDIQVFGREDSSDTRAALRFFRERRIVVHYSTFASDRSRPGSCAGSPNASAPEPSSTRRPGRTWTQGLAYLSLDDAGIVTRVLADPRLLRLPLVRHGNEVTVGRAEATWAGWLRPSAGPDRRPGHDDSRPRAARRPTIAHRMSSVMKPEPRMTPVPWPIQTSPTATRTAAMIQRVRMPASRWHPSPDGCDTPRGAPSRPAPRHAQGGAALGAESPPPRTRSSSSAGRRRVPRHRPVARPADPVRVRRGLRRDGGGRAGRDGLRLGADAAGRPALRTGADDRAAARRGRLRGHHRRRPGHDGGRQPWLPGGWRAVGRLQHRAAPRAGTQRVRRPRASSSATSSRARRCS